MREMRTEPSTPVSLSALQNPSCHSSLFYEPLRHLMGVNIHYNITLDMLHTDHTAALSVCLWLTSHKNLLNQMWHYWCLATSQPECQTCSIGAKTQSLMSDFTIKHHCFNFLCTWKITVHLELVLKFFVFRWACADEVGCLRKWCHVLKERTEF